MPSLKDLSNFMKSVKTDPAEMLKGAVSTLVAFYYDMLDSPAMIPFSKEHIMFVGLQDVSAERKALLEEQLSANGLMLKPLSELAIEPMTRDIFLGYEDNGRFGIVSSKNSGGMLSLRQRWYLRGQREQLHALSGAAGYLISGMSPKPNRVAMSLLVDKGVSLKDFDSMGAQQCPH